MGAAIRHLRWRTRRWPRAGRDASASSRERPVVACPPRSRARSATGTRRRAWAGAARRRRSRSRASSRTRSASVSTCAPPVIGMSRVRRPSSRAALPTPSGSSRSRAASSVAGVPDGELEALAADLRLELVGRALRDDLAVVDDHDVVGQQVGLLQVLRGQQEGGPAGDEVLDHLPHLGAAARVQARGRLVEEDDRRVRHERAGEVEPAAHAARVRLGRAGRRRPRAGTTRAARAPAPGTA